MATTGRHDSADRAILRLLLRNGRLSATDATRYEQVVANTGVPIYELLEKEGVILQSDLAELLAQNLFLKTVPSPERLDVKEIEGDVSDLRTSIRDAELAPLPPAVAIPIATPAPVVEPSTTTYSNQAIPPPQVRTHKALVVDDDPDLRRIVRTMLERSGLGLAVITAQDGIEALSMLEIERPDIVVLDVAMPGMDGFEVCRRVRADQQTAGVPVLLLTARDTIEDVARGFREGADDYVVKPFRSEELIARIRRMIHRTYGDFGAAFPAGSAEPQPRASGDRSGG